MYWFTADEHLGHENIIKYCNRPFSTVEEMDATIIDNYNQVVLKDDIVVHAGDFCWLNNFKDVYKIYVQKLNGTQIFLRGSHDHWLPYSSKYIWTKRIEGQLVVVCHYAMLRWPGSHYNSWQLFGHSHGRLVAEGKQYDIGVDNNNFYPVSFDQLVNIMKEKPDNPNFIKRKRV